MTLHRWTEAVKVSIQATHQLDSHLSARLMALLTHRHGYRYLLSYKSHNKYGVVSYPSSAEQSAACEARRVPQPTASAVIAALSRWQHVRDRCDGRTIPYSNVSLLWRRTHPVCDALCAASCWPPSRSATSWSRGRGRTVRATMSVSLRSMLVEGPHAPKPKGPYTYANTPRALYNNAKLKKDPSW